MVRYYPRRVSGQRQTIKTTDEHPFRIVNRQAWVKAKDLNRSDRVVSPHGEVQQLVSSVHEPHPDGIKVYNFEVEDLHTYYIHAPQPGSP